MFSDKARRAVDQWTARILIGIQSGWDSDDRSLSRFQELQSARSNNATETDFDEVSMARIRRAMFLIAGFLRNRYRCSRLVLFDYLWRVKLQLKYYKVHTTVQLDCITRTIFLNYFPVLKYDPEFLGSGMVAEPLHPCF